MKYLCEKFMENILDMAITAIIGGIISYVAKRCWNQARVQEMHRKFEELLVRAKVVNPTAQQLNTANLQVQQLPRELQDEARQVEVSSNREPLDNLLEHGELTLHNNFQSPSRSNSFDAGLCEALVQQFVASMLNRGYVGPSHRKLKKVFMVITFIIFIRKQARRVPLSIYRPLENTNQPQQANTLLLPLFPCASSPENNSDDQGDMDALSTEGFWGVCYRPDLDTYLWQTQASEI